MLQVMNAHLDTHTKGEQVLESIEYRNLAPLYCDEEMRVCGMEKKTLPNGSIYDLWIEGPTGGVAVKGTVRTTTRKRTSDIRAEAHSKNSPKQSASPELKSTSEKLEPADKHDETGPATPSSPSATAASEPSAPSEGEKSMSPLVSEVISQSSSRKVTAFLMRAPGRASRRSRTTRLRSYQFISLPTKAAPPIRPVQPFIPAKPVMSRQTKSLLRRLLRETRPAVRTKLLPLARKYAASPYIPDPARTASRHSRFLREGARRIGKPSIRFSGETLARWCRRRKFVT
jgi:hypothetical protein